MKENSCKQSNGKKRFIPIMLLIFSVGFVFGAYKTIAAFIEDRHSISAYHELREYERESSTPQPDLSQVPDIGGNGDTETSAVEEKQLRRRQSMDIRSLQDTYPELKAWIVAEETGIDYPIMQAADNEYYLTHLYDGTSNSNGSIFLDCENSGMFMDDNTVIYGHHMKSGAMFQPLMNFKDQEYYDTHPTMMICTEEGDYLIELICGTIEDGNYGFIEINFGDFDAMSEYVDKLKARSTFDSEVELLPGDRLLSMCTCTYERQNARYMLVGKITELYE